MLLYDVIMTSFSVYLFTVSVIFSLGHAAHVLLHVRGVDCCVKKRQTSLRPTGGLQTAQISILWITRSEP